MQTKTLAIAVIKKGNQVLMRKKPEGSKPYKETWYLFGCEFAPEDDQKEALKKYLSNQIGITVEVTQEFGSAEETKEDYDGETKQFVYLNMLCAYISGEPRVPEGTERVEWVEIEKLREYDIVPPSVELFKKLGYLK